MATKDQVNQELDHLFRRQAGRIVALLTRVFGPAHIDLAETVVQDALLKAVQTWPLNGIPDNPAGWIMRVARNKAVDMIRANRELCADDETLATLAEMQETPSGDDRTTALDMEISDDQLRLIFTCCHPVISHESRVALTLKTVCGFGVREIAKAFLTKEETIAQRLVRAKQKIRDERLPFEFPARGQLAPRLDAVLDTIYLLFNEGYGASSGDELIREDICAEACRLARTLAENPALRRPKVQALTALLFLQASRLKARLDANGEILLLEEQDRSTWDGAMIATGLHYLVEAASGDELSRFHLFAGIAACHASAPSFEKTDWQRILAYYDELCAGDHSPVIALNRAVAVSFVSGPQAALRELGKSKNLPALSDYYLFPATVADFHRRMGELSKAIKFYRQALASVRTEPEKRFLLRRLKQCGHVEPLIT